jgi:hypothetical protein
VPTPRTWLSRIYEIIEILKSSSAEEYDRASIEKLFELQRRAALLLMKQVGTVPKQGHSVVPRLVLLAWVQKIEATEAQDLVRRQQVSEQIDQDMAERRAAQAALQEAGKKTIEFPLTRAILEASLTSLPPDVHIVPGRITINFDPNDPIQACERLYALGLALANDFESFAAINAGSATSRATGSATKSPAKLSA